jgi:hypothetical protein
MTFPTEDQLNSFLYDQTALISELVVRRILHSSLPCDLGAHHLPSVPSRRFVCRCSRRRVTRSIFTNSFFSNVKLPVHVVFKLSYDWLCSLSVSVTSVRRGVRRGTVSALYGHNRQLVAHSARLAKHRVGGYGVTVQVDEMFLPAHDCWILGVVEVGTGRVALFTLANRDASSIHTRLQSVIDSCTRLVTDALPSYVQVARLLGCVHHVVNKSVQYVGNALRVHTNHVESLWRVLRAFLSGKTHIELGLLIEEFAWRQNNKSDLWSAYLHALSTVDYI